MKWLENGHVLAIKKIVQTSVSEDVLCPKVSMIIILGDEYQTLKKPILLCKWWASSANRSAFAVISTMALDVCCVSANACSTPAAASFDTVAISVINAFICLLFLAMSLRRPATAAMLSTMFWMKCSMVLKVSPVLSI